MGYVVSQRTVVGRPTAVVPATTTWAEFPSRWRELLDEVYAFLRGSDVRQEGHNVMLYLDDVPHVEVGVEVSGRFVGSGRVVSSMLPAGLVAHTVHRGPYDRLGEADAAVVAWCAGHGLALAGPRWEVYGDWAPDPADLETEVCDLLR
jgi:effector-binding domain-containing protein